MYRNRRLGRAAERVAQALEGRVMLSGTQLLSTADPLQSSTGATSTANLGGDLFYAASDIAGTPSTNGAGYELWKTDGTPAGTVMVKDIDPGTGSSNPTELVTVGNTIFFSANDGTDGYELWKTDGTADGTVMVKDIVTGPGSSNPTDLTNVNGKLFFSAIDAAGQSGLWTSDGTAAGTVELGRVTGSPAGSQITNVNGTAFFTGTDAAHGTELWKSDGTPGGTVLVKDITPGTASSSLGYLTALGSELFFTVPASSDGLYGGALWKSDGTAAGTVLVKQTLASNLYAFDGAIYFAGTDAVGGTQFNNLWKSDGTTAGTVQVTEFHTLQTSFLPVNYATLNGTLIVAEYNLLDDFIYLYRTDGTQAGTVKIAPNVYVDNNQNTFESTLVTANGLVYFIGLPMGGGGVGVYQTDGTPAGTVQADPAAVGQVKPIHLMGQADNTLIFAGVPTSQTTPPQVHQNVYGMSIPPAASGRATFVRADNSTTGAWQGTYGSDGFDFLDGPANLPAYAQVSAANDAQWNWTWPDPNSDARALQAPPPSSGRIAACDYSGSSFTLDVNLTDGQAHQVALYLVDYDYRNRSETVQVSDAGTGQVLDTQNVSGFQGGRWLVYDLSGHVTITVTNNSGSANAVASGLMFDPVTAAGATATFAKADTATLGGWIGTYGTGGYSVIDGTTNLPASAQLSTSGAQEYTWADPATDPRAPQIGPGTQGRVAATLYSFSSFSLDLNLTDGQPHQVGFFVLDFDGAGRIETVQVSDATTGAVLDSRTVSNFAGGQYLDYNLSGHVKITFTNDNPQANAVLSGIFIDPVQTPVTQPPTATASFATADFSTQGNWSGKYGGGGYYIADGNWTLPVHPQPGGMPVAEYDYATNPTDPRALQAEPGSTNRVEAVDYAPTDFTYNLNLTDGKVHQLAIYIADYDYQNRSETIQFSDANTGAVLNTVYAYDFQGGQYVIWNASGDVNIKFTQVSGPNAVSSGVFLD
ncbi:MAG TPA: ELWxxDGT repeat protein [Tepidisphaeraceae bacterium]